MATLGFDVALPAGGQRTLDCRPGRGESILHGPQVQADLGLSYTRANKLVGQLVDIGIFRAIDPDAYNRRFFAPRVLAVLSSEAPASRQS